MWPITLFLTASLGLFIYLNEEDDNTDFWKTIETGGAIVPDDDDEEGRLSRIARRRRGRTVIMSESLVR